MTLHLQCSQEKREKGKKRREKRSSAESNGMFRPSAWMRWQSSSYWCLPAINLSWWRSRASEPSALTDVQIIELSISPNYQSCIKIIHLLVNIKHIMSLLCVLGEVGKVKHSM